MTATAAVRERRRARVVIADDSAAVSCRLEVQLADTGDFEVVGRAGDAPQAIQLIERLQPDGVVLDLRMPGGGGIAVLRAAQEMKAPPRIVVLTNYPEDGYRDECLALGAHAFLDKSQAFQDVPAVLLASNGDHAEQVRPASTPWCTEGAPERFEYLFANSPAVVYTARASGDYGATFVSPNVVNQLGYEPREFTEDPAFWLDHVHPQDRERVLGEVSRVFQDGHVALEYRFRGADGRFGWMRDDVRLVSGQRGEPSELVGAWTDITERKRAEDALKLFRSLVDRSNDAVEVLDPETAAFIDVNDRGCRDLGYSREELLSLSVFDIDPMVDQSTFVRSVKELRERGSLLWEGVHRRKDSSRFPVEVNLSYVRLDRDYIVAVVRDITERKRAEAALRESEERYRSLVRGAPYGIYRSTMDGRFLTVNPALVSMLGYESEEELLDASIGRDVYRSHEDRERLAGRLALDCLNGVEVGWKRKDGTPITIRASGRAVRDSEGRPDGFEMIVEDVTERRRAETALARLALVVEQSSDSVVVTDLDGTIQYVNATFERITGYTRDEVIGQNPRILQSGAHDAEFYRRMWSTLSEGRPWRGLFQNRRRDGTLYNLENAVFPVTSAPGDRVAYVAIGRDMTREHHLEMQLSQAQRLEAVGRLAGGVAHDFNNLLTVILGEADLAGEVNRDATVGSSLEEIRKAGQRGADLIRQLLIFSRQQVVAFNVFDANAAVRDVEKMLQRVIGEDIALRTALAPDLPPVWMDHGQLGQVLMNLAVNARDAMPDGGALTIETMVTTLEAEQTAAYPDVKSGEYVLLAVSDTGVGMPEQVKAHIFEPFFTTKGSGKGTGLGLATCYGIIRQAGGHIAVYSEPGVGTTMKVYLPPAGERDAEPAVIPPAPVRQGTETILVVEDEPSVRDMAVRILQAQGYHVLQAGSGDEAFQVLERTEGPVHLLVTDLVLSDTHGGVIAELAVAMRPTLKVLYCSGYTSDAALRRKLLEQEVPFLLKPFTSATLAGKVREVLDDVQRR